MYKTKKIAYRRDAFTLIEMLVVIAIILAVAALAAAFAPRVNDSQKLTRAVDNLQQWLLTAKMRAKRDGLATGLRFIQAPGDAAGTYSQFQYIQQPEPLAGGTCISGPLPVQLPPAYQYQAGLVTYQPGVGNWYTGGLIISAGFALDGVTLVPGQVNFAALPQASGASVDFWLGNPLTPNQWLVQPGDYLEINGGGVYVISVATGPTTLQLGGLSGYSSTLLIPNTSPTTNYRIIRQPRILIGEEPLTLPSNYAVDMRQIGVVSQGPTLSNYLNPAGWNQPSLTGPSFYYDIVFSPSGAVIGANAANGLVALVVYDLTMNPYDPNLTGVIGVQTRSGFIGAYSLSQGTDPFYFARIARESGL